MFRFGNGYIAVLLKKQSEVTGDLAEMRAERWAAAMTATAVFIARRAPPLIRRHPRADDHVRAPDGLLLSLPLLVRQPRRLRLLPVVVGRVGAYARQGRH